VTPHQMLVANLAHCATADASQRELDAAHRSWILAPRDEADRAWAIWYELRYPRPAAATPGSRP
jgi:hypothetical protein